MKHNNESIRKSTYVTGVQLATLIDLHGIYEGLATEGSGLTFCRNWRGSVICQTPQRQETWLM